MKGIIWVLSVLRFIRWWLVIWWRMLSGILTRATTWIPLRVLVFSNMNDTDNGGMGG